PPHVLDPDTNLTTLTQKPLDELNLRTLSQIIRPGLETQAQDTDLLFVCLQNRINGPLDMLLIAGQNCFEQGQPKILFLGAIGESPEVFRETRPSEGEAGVQIGARNVQLRVRRKDSHHSL